MNALQFLKTMTVEQFKRAVGSEKIDIKCQAMKDQNGNIMKDSTGKTIFHRVEDGKFFFVAGEVTGAVSTKGIPQHPMVSEVLGDNGRFFLIHEEGTGGSPTVASF